MENLIPPPPVSCPPHKFIQAVLVPKKPSFFLQHPSLISGKKKRKKERKKERKEPRERQRQ